MKYRIWNHCCDYWWRPDSKGYTYDISEAGIYDEDEARDIHGRDHRAGCRCDRLGLADQMIPAPDHAPRRKGPRRRGKEYEYRGQLLTLPELRDLAHSNGCPVSNSAMWHRLEINGWSVEDAVNTPPKEVGTRAYKTRTERANDIIDRTMREVSK